VLGRGGRCPRVVVAMADFSRLVLDLDYPFFVPADAAVDWFVLRSTVTSG
jgi:hypothetical protein